MNTIDERAADVSRSGTSTPAPAADPFREATGRLRTEVEATWVALKRSLYVERQSIGLSIFEGAFKLATFIALGATAIALTILAAFLFVGSARAGMALWTNNAWWSDLVIAVALGGLIVLAAHSVRRYVHRAVLASTLRHLAKPPESAA